MLRPQDVMVLGWIGLQHDKPWRYMDLAHELYLSASESHASVRRLTAAGLLLPAGPHPYPNESVQPYKSNARFKSKAALEFLLHGVPYAFFAQRGPLARGVPTGVAAPPLNAKFSVGDEIPVWPDAEGEARGYALQPLYKSAPVAARRNPRMYEYLALVDALRDGRVREKEAARKYLEKMFREK